MENLGIRFSITNIIHFFPTIMPYYLYLKPEYWYGVHCSSITQLLPHLNIIDHSTQGASLVAQLVKNLPAMQETRVWSLGWEDPLEKGVATYPVFWPGEFHGLYRRWSCKESDMTERLSLSLFSQAKPILWNHWVIPWLTGFSNFFFPSLGYYLLVLLYLLSYSYLSFTA